jgi:hypothetical protein
MTVKERLHQVIDTLSPEELEAAERLLSSLRSTEDANASDGAFRTALAAQGIAVTPAHPESELPRLVGVPGGIMASDLVIQMREERYRSL